MTGSAARISCRASRFKNVSAFSKSGNCQAEPFSQKELPPARGKSVSRSRQSLKGIWGIKVPSLNLIAWISVLESKCPYQHYNNNRQMLPISTATKIVYNRIKVLQPQS